MDYSSIMKMKAVNYSEKLVNFYCPIPEHNINLNRETVG
jgi:hypothetical protein